VNIIIVEFTSQYNSFYILLGQYKEKNYRCKISGCRKSKASKGDAVVNYREPLATKELRYHGLSLRVKNLPYETFLPGIHAGLILKVSV